MTRKYSPLRSDSGFLLDTHAFIWWMEKSKNLSKDIFDLLNDPQQNIFLSVVIIWEIVIKKAKKQLKTPRDIEAGVKRSGFVVLPIEMPHVLEVEKLFNYHSDPFDRILVAQARIEGLTLITRDPKIWKYDVSVLKC